MDLITIYGNFILDFSFIPFYRLAWIMNDIYFYG